LLAGADRCTWGAAAWSNPISAAELSTAGSIIRSGGGGVEILTGGDFTDTRLKAMENLDEFRILHFATHGLVTAPQPGCPPRPALLTSFGDGGSDGLLTFAEIFDLSLDADLVILSACNTASTSGLAANLEAGVTIGGDFALDGLVRAFVGAGGRTVVASHWPVPDDYNATGRLITGFFETAPGVATAEALRLAQVALMDDAETSHPFYWSAFAVVGDGAMVLRR
jgi:CHAT domain-containing protein